MKSTSPEPSPLEPTNFRRSRLRLERLSERLQGIVPRPGDDLFHIQRFIENLKIINKRGELVSLIMNRSQESVFHRLMECREKRVPARFICCKSRQLGISTLIEAFIFALITHYPNRSRWSRPIQSRAPRRSLQWLSVSSVTLRRAGPLGTPR